MYNFFKYFGSFFEYFFDVVIFNKKVNRVIYLFNGLIIYLYKFWCFIYYLWKFLFFVKVYFLVRNKLKFKDYDLIYMMSFYNFLGLIVGR